MCQLVYAFPRKCAKLLSPSTFSPPLQYLFSYSSKRKSYHDFNERIHLLFDISLPSRVLFFLFPTNVSILVRVRRYFPRSHEIFGRRKWQRSCSSRTRFSRTIWTRWTKGERMNVCPLFRSFFFLFFFGGRELPRATKSGPTLSGRHAKIEGRGTKGDIEDAFIWYCEDVRAHKKTGARPSAASPLSLGRPRPWKRTRLGSKVAAAAGCRFLNPANETC